MIDCTCPYCGMESIVSYEGPIEFEKANCPECNEVVFIMHCRWIPHVFKPDQLKIDKENKSIEIIDKDALEEVQADYREFGRTLTQGNDYYDKLWMKGSGKPRGVLTDGARPHNQKMIDISKPS